MLSFRADSILQEVSGSLRTGGRELGTGAGVSMLNKKRLNLHEVVDVYLADRSGFLLFSISGHEYWV
jgi:hypothetical protein